MSENPHPRADELSRLSTRELLLVMHREDRRAVKAVEAHLDEVAAAVDAVAERLRRGGRLHYFGAGTSGRLAALDAAECPATFGVAADLVHAHDAGDGEPEDDDRRGAADARAAGLRVDDAVVGVSAGGRTAYVLGALAEAHRAASLVVGISCAPGSPLGAAADLAIEVETGPEVIAGSTRLKAGTVQKVVLNMLSTGVFTTLGHTYRGRMVDVVAANEKLRGRAARIVADLTGAPAGIVERALADAGGSAKLAILMLRCGLAAGEARSRLSSAGGDLSVALGET
ncbi:MAG: N-acetylmuramic acid 6-phosphate etherase [Candidatus Dormibacteraeota bacterium]|nr:N-acetylmuramic acid 6-phosphate etherase [Candidatus Dormibacteraeota bacterium]